MTEQLTKIYTEGAQRLVTFDRFDYSPEKEAIFGEVKAQIKAIGGTYDVNRLLRAEDNLRFAGERKVYANMAGQVIG